MLARAAFLALALALGMAAHAAAPAAPFAVEVVDEDTGRGVPLVELKTVNSVRCYTDSSGLAAIDEPGLEGQKTHFAVSSHGYEFPADGFGIRGVALQVERGKIARIKIHRKNIAERLYRITGEGIYRDSVLLGRKVPIRKPLLNAQVLGQDSVQTAVYHGRMFWMWGDTSRAAYPLGNFNMSGATTPLPSGGLEPDRGIDLEYFTAASGFTRGMAPLPGEGPTWLDGLVVLPEEGQERLFAAYVKIRNHLEAYERGLCCFDDQKGQFERLQRFPKDAPLIPFGHPEQRGEYVYFGNPFPWVRVRATSGALRDLSQYEAYTPLQAGTRVAETRLDRDADGKLRYAWRRNTPTVTPEDQEKLIRDGKLRREECLVRLQDPDNGKTVIPHSGTVRWNPYRNRWIMVAVEIGGTSQLGEVWYAEAERPEGPWRQARKIVTHNRYSFYNPMQHVEFDQHGGRVIYFEGTYTAEFSGNSDPTPRYDYNQIMYRLDLSDPRLKLPSNTAN